MTSTRSRKRAIYLNLLLLPVFFIGVAYLVGETDRFTEVLLDLLQQALRGGATIVAIIFFIIVLMKIAFKLNWTTADKLQKAQEHEALVRKRLVTHPRRLRTSLSLLFLIFGLPILLMSFNMHPIPDQPGFYAPDLNVLRRLHPMFAILAEVLPLGVILFGLRWVKTKQRQTVHAIIGSAWCAFYWILYFSGAKDEAHGPVIVLMLMYMFCGTHLLVLKNAYDRSKVIREIEQEKLSKS